LPKRRRSEPNLAALLDLVALGTVADVVRLDHNNRVLVSQGLQRIRQGQLTPGLRAIFRAAGRNPAQASGNDLGFMIGPRLNAAGRLADMSLGIECLITDDEGRAMNIAQQLDALNRERREIESGMQEQALLQLAEGRSCADLDGEAATPRQRCRCSTPTGTRASSASSPHASRRSCTGRCLPSPAATAARSRARAVRSPACTCATPSTCVAKRAPGLLLRFGGHAMAAGVTMRESDFARFRECSPRSPTSCWRPPTARARWKPTAASKPRYFSIATARLLEAEVWGQGFPAPLFEDEFVVESQRILKDKHLKLRLRKGTQIPRRDPVQLRPGARQHTSAPLTGWRSTTTTASRRRS
jgi:single-stranded-DNA-specific exonuclease